MESHSKFSENNQSKKVKFVFECQERSVTSKENPSVQMNAYLKKHVAHISPTELKEGQRYWGLRPSNTTDNCLILQYIVYYNNQWWGYKDKVDDTEEMKIIASNINPPLRLAPTHYGWTYSHNEEDKKKITVANGIVDLTKLSITQTNNEIAFLFKFIKDRGFQFEDMIVPEEFEQTKNKSFVKFTIVAVKEPAIILNFLNPNILFKLQRETSLANNIQAEQANIKGLLKIEETNNYIHLTFQSTFFDTQFSVFKEICRQTMIHPAKKDCILLPKNCDINQLNSILEMQNNIEIFNHKQHLNSI